MNENKNRVEVLRRHIQAARREIPAELVLKNGKVVNVFSGEIQECDVAVYNGFVVGLGSDYNGREEIDLKGKWISPGFIDGHIHIESSMLLPSRLAAALLPHGTTTVVSDPHEIANVMGIEGILLMILDSQSIPFDIFFMAPSCVPATHLETSGAQLLASDLLKLVEEPKILGLAEMMNFPGVLSGDPEILEKLILFKDKIIDGHAPALKGDDLQAYLTAGIGSDHETWDRQEGREKIRGGMMLMIREGSTAKNLEELLPLVNLKNARRCCFVSDDLHPRDILKRGHLNAALKKAVRLGLDPITALQMVTINPAEYFRLKQRGAIAPGFRADLVVLKDLINFTVEKVYKDGRLIADSGKIVAFPNREEFHLEVKPLNIAPFTPESFRIRDQGRAVRVIEFIPGQILT
ncbi:MAG: amidohydrolase family protein, partial [Pseudomonadota bacterium]